MCANRNEKVNKEDLIHQFSDEIKKCILCGSCQAVCPVYAESLDETKVARGRMALLNAVLEGELDLTPGLSEILATCIGCKACSEHCPSGAAADLANLAAKITLGSQRGLPYYHKLLARQVFANPGILSASARLIDVLGRKIYTPLAEIPFFQPALPYVHHGKPRKIPPMGGKTFREINHENRVPKKARGRVALFYGCAIDQIYPHLGKTAIEILNDAGFEVFIPKELTCCGAPVLSMGDIKTARKMMETNLSVLAEQNVDAVITLCATCGSTLKELYPKLFGHDETHLLSDKIMDFQEFLVSRGLFEKAPDTSEKHSPLRVTYHDPCHLNRGMNVQKAPREILKNLPDIDFIEMKDADRCCGGGGLFSLSHYDLSLEIGMHKIEAIMESGAEVVATACPSCILHLSDLLQRQGASIQVVHVCELMKPKKD